MEQALVKKKKTNFGLQQNIYIFKKNWEASFRKWKSQINVQVNNWANLS